MTVNKHVRNVKILLVPFLAIFLALAPARAQTLLRDAEIETWLREYSEPLFEAAGLNAEAVEIYIVGDPSLNAFVTAGLRVFVHTGLITAADTPNQVEGVLAHETGHLAGGHQQRGAEARATAGRSAMLSLVLGAAVIAAGGSPEAGMGIVGLGQSIGISEYLAYNRGQEAAADQAAVGYLEAVGSSGQGLVDFFNKLSNRQLITSRRIDPYLLTHPLAIKRMSALRDRVGDQSNFDNADTEDEIFRLHMIQAKINGFMQDPQATMRQYPLRDQTPPARYARAVAYYRASQLDKASREIDRLIKDDPKNPYFWELKGQMLFEHGQIDQAVAPHRMSVSLAPQYALLKINLARALVALEDGEQMREAIEVLKSALRQEPDNGFGWSELARAYAFEGEQGLANLAQAQAFFAGGNLPEAHRFATRAKDALPAGTPEHLQSLDIINASEDIARKARRRGRR
ncbi:MAG: M48 family metalloprotease [Pseudomonadota bacterium]